MINRKKFNYLFYNLIWFMALYVSNYCFCNEQYCFFFVCLFDCFLYMRGCIHITFQYNISVDDFIPMNVIGQGSYAKVSLVKKKNNDRLYAMKRITKKSVLNKHVLEQTTSEMNVLSRVNHAFIVSLKYAFQDVDSLYLVMDFVSGGELYYHLDEVKRFPEPTACFLAAELVCALGYLHSVNVIYRDLKPENILLDMNGHICLTDFGLVKENMTHGKKAYTICGSPEYMAPEMLLGNGYDKNVDWWALGILLFEMLSGMPPFYDEDPEVMGHKIMNDKISFPFYFSMAAKALIYKLLEKDPSKRIGTGPEDQIEIRQHAFFNKMDWADLEEKKVPSPYIPPLRSETDMSYFDPAVTQQETDAFFEELEDFDVDDDNETNNNQSMFRQHLSSVVRETLSDSQQDLFHGFVYSESVERLPHVTLETDSTAALDVPVIDLKDQSGSFGESSLKLVFKDNSDESVRSGLRSATEGRSRSGSITQGVTGLSPISKKNINIRSAKFRSSLEKSLARLTSPALPGSPLASPFTLRKNRLSRLHRPRQVSTSTSELPDHRKLTSGNNWSLARSFDDISMLRTSISMTPEAAASPIVFLHRQRGNSNGREFKNETGTLSILQNNSSFTLL